MPRFKTALLSTAMLGLLACGGQGSSGEQPRQDAAEFREDQLQQLDELAVPAGVQDETWAALKSALRTALDRPAAKAALAAPVTAGSKATLALDTSSLTLSWYYACQGDYDQNGEVNISDLTPLGVHFGKSTGGGPFAPGTIEAAVDGDANGEVNIADVTPIAANFGARVGSYNVYRSTHISHMPDSNSGPNGAGAQLLGTLALSTASGSKSSERLSFSFELLDPNIVWIFWVRPNDAVDGSGADGTPSAPLNGSSYNLPPVASMYQPNPFGDVPFNLEFNLLGSTDPDGFIAQWEFDAHGEGEFELSWPAQPDPVTATYLEPGIFPATVRVTDNEGATGTYVIEVDARDPANTLPQAQIVADQTSGDVPLHVSFNAGGSSDPDGSIVLYEFDLDGVEGYELSGTSALAEYTYHSAGFYAARLRVTDDDGGRAVNWITINPSDPGNLAPIAKLAASPLSGERPLTVNFDASSSVDTDGEITEYNWDFDGDGLTDKTTAVPYASFTYVRQGSHFPRLYVRDNDWEASGEDSVKVELASGWVSRQVDSSDPQSTRVVVLSDGLPEPRPLVAYDHFIFPDGIRDIRVRLGAADLSSFSPEVVAAQNAFFRFDMQLVNGMPYISYCREGGNGVGGLCQTRALNNEATTWTAAKQIHLAGDNIAFDGIAQSIINGHPALLYLDGDTQRYIRANDNIGGTWGVPVTVGSLPGAWFRHPNLLESGGAVHSLTGDLGGTRAIHKRSADNGASWPGPLGLIASDNFNGTTSAWIIDGVPAVAYQQHSRLMLRKAQDAPANSWQPPVTVYASPVITGFSDIVLRTIGGIPAIACDAGGSAAIYITATDASGTSWNPPEVVDTRDRAGRGLSMTEFNGGPLLVYSGTLFGAPIRCAYLAP